MNFILSILLSTSAFVSAASSHPKDDGKKCPLQINIDSAAATKCAKTATKETAVQCFNQIFVGNSTITLGPNNQLSRAVFQEPQKHSCVTFNGWTFKTPIELGFITKDKIPSANSGNLKVVANGIEFQGYFCGWAPDGTFQRTLSPHFRFIPNKAAVTTIYPKCLGTREINATAVTLSSRTNICNMALSAETSFGYEPDSHYHFTALNDGTMKGTDRRGKPIDIPIKNGKDYRNADPAEHPCAWEETPEEVLNSFTEEHSE